MNYENEMKFLCEILGKCHINTSVLSASDSIGATVAPSLDSIVGYFLKPEATVQDVFGNIEAQTKYVFVNDFRFKYVCIRLPVQCEKNIFFIGPYLSSFPSEKDILELGERAGISPLGQKLLMEYCASLPIISENDRIFAVVDAFCEKIWQTKSFAIEEFQKNYSLPLVSIDNSPHGEFVEDVLAKAEMMEMRYSFENELIRAVSLGQQHKEGLLAKAFNEQMFEKRLQDPVRNAKNYCIIMNTLLRKAAEEGGVHPIHIDKLSSRFAAEIEIISDIKKVSAFMRDMFSSYCRLVRKHSVQQYSSVVKKTVIVIDSDLSAELSLSTLASEQGVSSGYLATVFKRETGKTVSEYVRDKRVDYAKYLLRTTNLQIQTVALYCGIMDVQYFTKIFKRQVGKTPRGYREDSKAKE